MVTMVTATASQVFYAEAWFWREKSDLTVFRTFDTSNLPDLRAIFARQHIHCKEIKGDELVLQKRAIYVFFLKRAASPCDHEVQSLF